eukprot:gene15422-21504_t
MLQEFNISIDALHGEDYAVRDILEPYVASLQALMIHRELRIRSPSADKMGGLTWPYGPAHSPCLKSPLFRSDYINYLLFMDPGAPLLWSPYNFPANWRVKDNAECLLTIFPVQASIFHSYIISQPKDLEDVTATWQLYLDRLTDWYPEEYQAGSNAQPLACQAVSNKDIKMVNPFADTGTHRQHIAHYVQYHKLITTLEDKLDSPSDLHHRGPQRPTPTRTTRGRQDTSRNFRDSCSILPIPFALHQAARLQPTPAFLPSPHPVQDADVEEAMQCYQFKCLPQSEDQPSTLPSVHPSSVFLVGRGNLDLHFTDRPYM